MSKSMKILLGVFGAVAVAAVLASMLGKLDLPIGPLNGMLAGEEEVVASDGIAPADPGAIGAATAECWDPVTGAPIDLTGVGAAGAAATPPATGAATDPTTGAAVDPATGAATTDPATGAATTDPATGAATTDPATGAPVASGSANWDGSERVYAAAGDGYDLGRVSDTRILAADATTDPAATGATDPAAAGATDPAVAGATDPAVAGATDPAAAGATDPAAAGAAGAADPCEAAGGTRTPPATAGATDPTTGAAGAATGAGTGAGAAAATAPRVTTDGTNNGNSPEALRAAKDATEVMKKAKIEVSTTATLVPSAGGTVTARPALGRYRASVKSAVLIMKLGADAKQQWSGAGKKVQIDLVRSFLTRLGKTYRNAARSVTVIDETGTMLAVGDAVAKANGAKVAVKLF